MFTHEEKLQLFKRLPALELSYEPKLHKKVHAALYYIIPKGPKALVWYTYWGEQHVCLLVLLNERGNYSDIKLFPACFSDALALGTIIYGTHFMHQQRAYFTCEQLYYYKGLPVHKNGQKLNYLAQLPLLLEMFANEVEQVAYTSNSLVIGLPAMAETYEEALDMMAELPYRTYGLGGINPPTPPFKGQAPDPPLRASPHALRESPHALRIPIEPAKVTNLPAKVTNLPASGGVACGAGGVSPSGARPLLVKAALTADTYQLYEPADKTFIGMAMIPTYKSSVFMNGLFRTIKENTNLDFLEESDDEDEFENIQLDKFVNLDKMVLMECVYLKRFQKWQPNKVIKMY
jgi:hypothetical protein